MQQRSSNQSKRYCVPSGKAIALGVGVGTAIGVATDQIALGVALGVAFGVAFNGAGMVRRNNCGLPDHPSGKAR